MTPMQWTAQQGMQATFGIQPQRTTRLNDSERLRIVRLHKQGMSQREIVQEVGRPRITVVKVIRRAEEMSKGRTA